MALVGNPNCGKTTLFNYASGSHERVGNYGGVTVDAKEATMKKLDYDFKLVDLPGNLFHYDLARRTLCSFAHYRETSRYHYQRSGCLEPGAQSFLTTQLIDMNIKVVIALNMYDELENKQKNDYKSNWAK